MPNSKIFTRFGPGLNVAVGTTHSYKGVLCQVVEIVLNDGNKEEKAEIEANIEKGLIPIETIGGKSHWVKHSELN
jgi:hypothetical protein